MVVPTKASDALPVLRYGDRGPAVVRLQDLLHRVGLLPAEPDGYFGPATLQAVKAFQEGEGLTADGVVGRSTWSVLQTRAWARPRIHVVQPGQTLSAIAKVYGTSVKELASVNGLTDPNRIRAGAELLIPTSGRGKPLAGDRPELVLWSEATSLFPRGEKARVIDVKTGRSFHIRRFAGTYHADVEPLSAQDTQIMREIYGGRWSWERRAIILEVGGRRLAASMNGQPHGRGAISENGFGGHFCIHLLGSHTHGTQRMDFQHQAKILEAAGYRGEPRWLATR